MEKPLATPFTYQVAPIAALSAILSLNKGAIDASPAGSGKTFVALFVAKQLGRKPFVLCPRSVKEQWRSAAEAVGIELLGVETYEAAVHGKKWYGDWKHKGVGRAKVTSFYQWNLPPDALLICDEAHRAKTRGAYTTAMIESAASLLFSFKILLLSATMADSPLHFTALGRVLNMFGKGQFFAWAALNGAVKTEMGWQFTVNPDDFSLRRPWIEQIHKQIFPSRGVKVDPSKEKGYPLNNISFLPIEEPKVSEQPEIVKAKLKELADKMAEDDPGNILLKPMRERQYCELAKATALAELAEDFVEEGHSVVLFVDYLATIECIAARLEPGSYGVVQGGVDVEELRQRFQNNSLPILICQSQVGGVGLSLHDLKGRPRTSLISPTWSAVNFRQILGRIHRAGALSPADQRIVYLRQRYIERRVINRVETKLKSLDLLTDGDLSYE